MDIDIQYRPAHSLAVVKLEAGESIRAESGAMVSMTSGVGISTDGPMGKKSGGLWKNLKRAVLSGETFFTNTFTATDGPGEVTLAPTLCGDMVTHELEAPQELFIQGSSYVAAPDSVQIDTKWQGFARGLLSGESMFFLHATGSGPVLLNAFGGIDVIDMKGETRVVDTGHLVAFTSGLSYEIGKASKGWIASFLSGEGLVLRVSGTGRLYVQTRNPNDYGSFLGGRLPPRKE